MGLTLILSETEATLLEISGLLYIEVGLPT